MTIDGKGAFLSVMAHEEAGSVTFAADCVPL